MIDNMGDMLKHTHTIAHSLLQKITKEGGRIS